MLNPFRKVKTTSEEVKHLQDAVALIFNQVLKKQIIDGRIIEDVVVNTGSPVSVAHGLGKAVRGWVVIKKNANADVWDSASVTPTATMDLNSSANVTISLWVF